MNILLCVKPLVRSPCFELIFDIRHWRWCYTRFLCSEPHSVEIQRYFKPENQRIAPIISYPMRARGSTESNEHSNFWILQICVILRFSNEQSRIVHSWHCFKGILIILIICTQSTFIGFRFNLYVSILNILILLCKEVHRSHVRSFSSSNGNFSTHEGLKTN